MKEYDDVSMKTLKIDTVDETKNNELNKNKIYPSE